MKYLAFLVVGICLCDLNASSWQLGGEVSSAHLSGVRAYQASQNNHQRETKDLTVHSLFIGKTINEKTQLRLRYTHYDPINSLGWANDAGIFEGPGGAQSVTPYRIEEEIREWSISYLLNLSEKGRLSFLVGLNLSFFESEADFFRSDGDWIPDYGNFNYYHEGRGRFLRNYSASDVAAGLEASAVFQFTEHVDLEFRYRLSKPPHRHIHLLSLGFAINL